MSGPVCPDCGHPVGVSPCDLCGWNGDVESLGRKTLTPEGEEAVAAESQAREEGRLFFILVEVEPGADLPDAIMGLFDAPSSSRMGTRHVMKVSTRPSDEAVRAVLALPGVKAVRVS
jgi:hypothetical protein